MNRSGLLDEYFATVRPGWAVLVCTCQKTMKGQLDRVQWANDFYGDRVVWLYGLVVDRPAMDAELAR